MNDREAEETGDVVLSALNRFQNDQVYVAGLLGGVIAPRVQDGRHVS